MKHIINYETTLIFDIEGNEFEMELEQIPGKEISPEYILSEFTNKLKEFNIEYKEEDVPLLIAKHLKNNLINYKYDGEIFFVLNNEVSDNRKENVVTYESEKCVIRGQDHEAMIKQTDMILESFKKKLEEKLDKQIDREEAVHYMANGAIWED